MEIHPPKFNHAFLEELAETGYDRRSFLKWERIQHSHGATLAEVYTLRHGSFPRCVDVVIYPASHEHVETIVQLANKHDVAIIPYGGGTNVTQALLLNPKESRMIVSLDMTRMNKIKWVDKINMMACIEAGIIGQDLERELKNYGVVLGHEPDSVEFSTLGGWISTRASGMKKNVYGNIEDIVQNVKLVTSKGTYTKKSEWPRVSNGPDLAHVVMGHEGNFGVVTEAILRVRPIPDVKEYSSIVFSDFEIGIKFMDEVARSRCWPASLRLVDNQQFHASQALKEGGQTLMKNFLESVKMFYVQKIKGFDIHKLVGCTIVFEGSRQEVDT
jgi:alkyldihydroxyacetonephosphate synthase